MEEHFFDEVELVIRKLGSAAVMGSVPLYVLDEASIVLEKLEEYRRQANRAFLKERRHRTQTGC